MKETLKTKRVKEVTSSIHNCSIHNFIIFAVEVKNRQAKFLSMRQNTIPGTSITTFRWKASILFCESCLMNDSMLAQSNACANTRRVLENISIWTKALDAG